MKELAVLFGAYIGIGILTCLVLSFRKGENPHAVKALDLFGLDTSPIGIVFSMVLWPLWVFMQIIEQDNFEPPKAREEQGRREDLNALIGCIGTTVTPMIPSGRINLGEKNYEAISDGQKLDRDEKVEVLAISMGILKVRRFQPVAGRNH